MAFEFNNPLLYELREDLISKQDLCVISNEGKIVLDELGSEFYGVTAVLVGTAQAGASSTITLTSSASVVDDRYNNFTITITGGTGSGQSKLITDYVGSTKVATISGTWTTNPDNTSVYSIACYNESKIITGLSINSFYVNYLNSIITFNSSEIGQTVLVSYQGRGVIEIPATRIYTKSVDGASTESMQDVANSVGDASTVLANLNASISTGGTTKTNLDSSISNAVSTKSQLDSINSEALITKTDLTNINNTANSTKNDLTTLIENNQYSIDSENTRISNEEDRVLVESSRVIEYQAMINSSKMILKNPVSNYSNITTTYPSPVIYWTVRTIDDGKLYRYDGSIWVWIDTLNTNVYDTLLADFASYKADNVQRLALKANDNEVRKTAVKIEPEDASATFLGLVTGTGGPINLLSIPQDESVDTKKLTQSLQQVIIDLHDLEADNDNKVAWANGGSTIVPVDNNTVTFTPASTGTYGGYRLPNSALINGHTYLFVCQITPISKVVPSAIFKVMNADAWVSIADVPKLNIAIGGTFTEIKEFTLNEIPNNLGMFVIIYGGLQETVTFKVKCFDVTNLTVEQKACIDWDRVVSGIAIIADYAPENLLSKSIKGTKQLIFFNENNRIQKVEYRDANNNVLIREDIFIFSDLDKTITEIRTLIKTSKTLTFINHLDTLETEVI